VGLIEAAEGGTLFLNEIGETPLAIQAKLLNVIESKEIRQLGGTQVRKIDVRFIAATNRDLESMVAEGCFRRDLYHRLCQCPLKLAPLRERREDIIPLLQYLCEEKGLSLRDDVIDEFEQLRAGVENYSWCGNVREMASLVERVTTLHLSNQNGGIVAMFLKEMTLKSPDAEFRNRVLETLHLHNGNKSRAAQELGMARTTFLDSLKRFNIKD
jgi:sigma-54-dependent transcriptional regulator